MRKKILAVIALSVAVLVCAVQSCFAVGPIDEKENAHLARLNEARKASGLAELSLSTELTAAAKTRAKEIVDKFSHDRPNGTKFFTAIENQSGWNGISENIAAGKGLDTAYNAVDVLMASAGHRANILTKDNVCVGVATYQDAKGEYFWVEIFAVVRPARDVDKSPLGDKSEPTFIQSVNDPSLTVNGAGVPNSSIGTFDYYANASRASVTQLIKDSQARGNYTLFVLWNTTCGNINYEQVQAEAHARKQSVTISGKSANTDTTLPRIFELDNVDIILFNYYGEELDGGRMKSAMDTYCPSFGAANSVWKNAVLLRTTDRVADETISKGYSNFFPGVVPANSNPSVTLYVLYHDGKMVAKAQGTNQSNTFDQWAKKIAALSDARMPNADSGSGDEKDDGGEGSGDEENDSGNPSFTIPTTADDLKTAIGDEAAKSLTSGANIVTFVNGKYDALTNENMAPTPTFKKSQRIHHTLYMMDESGAIDKTRDGEKVKADVMRGEQKIITKELTIIDGLADLDLNIDDILAEEQREAVRAQEIASRSSEGYSLRIYNEIGDIDLTTNFRIDTANDPQTNGGSGGGCSMGFGLAAVAGLAALALRKRGR